MTTIRPEPLAEKGRALDVDPESVKAARGFAGEVLGDLAETDSDHVEAVILVISELVTNALRYGASDRKNLWLDIEIYERWTIVRVDDRDPNVYESRHDPANELRESGRGREIVEFLSARFWWIRRDHSKTAVAVVLRTDATLDARDLALLDRLEDSDPAEESGRGSSPPPAAVEEHPSPRAPRRPPSAPPAAAPTAAFVGEPPVISPDSSGLGPA